MRTGLLVALVALVASAALTANGQKNNPARASDSQPAPEPSALNSADTEDVSGAGVETDQDSKEEEEDGSQGVEDHLSGVNATEEATSGDPAVNGTAAENDGKAVVGNDTDEPSPAANATTSGANNTEAVVAKDGELAVGNDTDTATNKTVPNGTEDEGETTEKAPLTPVPAVPKDLNVTTTTNTTTPHPSVGPAPHARHFDGWSFFGGILLSVGVLTVAFVVSKYYKKKRQNYEPLQFEMLYQNKD